MSIRLSFNRAVVGGMLGFAALAAAAQASAPALSDLRGRNSSQPRVATPGATPPASAPSVRLRPLDETGAATAPTGNIQQERGVVVPQVSLPLGRTPASPTAAETRRLDARRPALRGGIDDAAARCEGESDPQARARCRNRVPVGTTPVGVPR